MELSQAMEAVSRYTADQWGLVTAAQAKATEVNAMTLVRLVDAGLLERVRRGCYLATSAPTNAYVRERAAWLLLNPTAPAWERPRLDPDGGVLSHSSATVLHELGDLLGETVEITVPRRRTTREPDVRTRVAVLTENEVTLIDGLPVTTAERTILDLLGDHLDGGHIGQIIYDAITAGKVDTEQLTARMGGFARRYGIARKDGHALLEDLLTQAGHRPEDLNRPRIPQRAMSHPLSVHDMLPGLTVLAKAVQVNQDVFRQAMLPGLTVLAKAVQVNQDVFRQAMLPGLAEVAKAVQVNQDVFRQAMLPGLVPLRDVYSVLGDSVKPGSAVVRALGRSTEDAVADDEEAGGGDDNDLL